MQLLAMVKLGFDYILEYTRRSPEFSQTLQIKFYRQLPWILQELLLVKLYSPASLSIVSRGQTLLRAKGLATRDYTEYAWVAGDV